MYKAAITSIEANNSDANPNNVHVRRTLQILEHHVNWVTVILPLTFAFSLLSFADAMIRLYLELRR